MRVPIGAVTPGRRPGAPALIAVAHGSRDPRSAATMAGVAAALAAARPDLEVRLAFLDLCAPSVEQVVAELAASGHTDAIVVPLLLGSAYHARVDLPGLLDAARLRHPRLRLTQARVLGADPRLVAALRDRVIGRSIATEAGIVSRIEISGGRAGSLARMRSRGAPDDVASVTGTAEDIPAVVVAAVGSSNAAANARTRTVADALRALTGWDTESCFATAAPGIEDAVARLRARGRSRVVVAPWFLAPGLLTDRLAESAPDIAHAATIGAHPALIDVIAERYDDARTAALELSA